LPLIIAIILGAMVSVTIIKLREHFHESETTAEVKEKITRIFSQHLFPDHKNPRIMVSGSEEKTIICQICLGRIKEGSRYIQCDCNRAFHYVCLSRTGFCPYCHKQFDEIKYNVENVSELAFICPLCGTTLDSGTRQCSCGAIFTEEGSDFCCPVCGTRVPEGETRCSYCGEVFESHRMVVCPLCGQFVLEEGEICECGALLGDRCPECGARLEPDAIRCETCNSEFEFI